MQTIVSTITAWISTRIARPERGAAAVEYGLLVALIAVAVVVAVMTLGTKLNSTFCYVVSSLPFGPESCPS
ncbi:MAG TPA: Flp family type IVb pilin [Actinomycetota bacterium]|nr:Flp family type IVb pilin [Actinomycetota bacterium]